MQMKHIDFLHKPMFVSVCCNITTSLQPVWPIVLYVKILLNFPLQCRTDTLRFPYLSVCMQQPYCVLLRQAIHRNVRFPFYVS